MRTWRAPLRTCNRSSFAESEYFKKYNSFLNSKELYEILKKYDYELIFYPHFEVHRFLDCFNSDNPRVKIADFKNNDVQDLLINTDILITDFSSVFFDYVYMRKPVIYYQYDEAAFRAEQYSQGYFDYKRDGFGDVVETEEDLYKGIIKILDNNLCIEDKYLAKINAFFKFNDNENCRRVYDAICSLL